MPTRIYSEMVPQSANNLSFYQIKIPVIIGFAFLSSSARARLQNTIDGGEYFKINWTASVIEQEIERIIYWRVGLFSEPTFYIQNWFVLHGKD